MARPVVQTKTCAVCGKTFRATEMRSYGSLRPGVNALLAADHPDWGEGSYICRGDLVGYRGRHVENLLTAERGELTALDREVIESLSSGGTISRRPEDTIDPQATFGDRMSDRVAQFGGSWAFILSFSAALVVWMALNVTGLLFNAFDPYPFILLNLVLSSLAAFQAPIIMMSQRRQETKDRLRAENDYRVNLKAELEIRQLHEKIDHQLLRQWEKLAELQQIQIDLLEEAAHRSSKGQPK